MVRRTGNKEIIMRTTTTTPARPTRRIRRFLLVGGVAALLAVGTAACGGGDDSNAKQAAKTTSTLAASAASTTAPAGGGATGQNTGSQSGGGGGSTATGPTITSFQTPDNIDCHNGDFQMFTASWNTSNAVKVTMSIDGPGVYKTYDGPSGSDSFPFNCSTSHTFLLTAYGSDGHTATQTITLQPRNVQSPTTTSTSQP
jgi:hypothetical protein